MLKLLRCGRACNQSPRQFSNFGRNIQISALHKSSDELDGPSRPPPGSATNEARFEVIGSQSSLLSVRLAASRSLYTRRGTVIGIEGKAENVTSTLSSLGPFRRLLLRLPFLYQNVLSSSPVTLLISTKPSNSSVSVIHVDGTEDWVLVGKSLLAWTGRTLSLSPVVSNTMTLAHWGSTEVTGRGLVAVAGQGALVQLDLQADETYNVHPSNLVAYSMSDTAPLPYRLQTAFPKLQMPSISNFVPQSRFINAMRESDTWKTVAKSMFAFRTWARATVWGDRLLLQFRGPATLLLQSHPSRLSDVLTPKDINEIAEAPPGGSSAVLESLSRSGGHQGHAATGSMKAPRLGRASIGNGGNAKIELGRDS